jgi:cellulose synthase/poly-beta-1,6-N-acetylglucosamine synthase-like glycosyltransferase
MAVRNGQRFIQEQLDSIARQTRLPDEVIVSDNCSDDCTVEIVRRFALRVPFPIRLFINARNLGVSKNFERAIQECTGDIIFLSDCDDVWYPEKINLMAAAFAASPKSGIAICDASLVDEKLRPLGRRLWQAWGFAVGSRKTGRLANGKFFDPSIPWFGACMAFRGSLRMLILPMPEQLGHDWFIARTIVCSGAGGTAIVPFPLMAYRQHPWQITGVSQLSPIRRLLGRFKGRNQRPTHVLAPVIDRLGELSFGSAATNPLLLTEALRHFHARCDLPANKISRIPVITRELVRFRYHRFSGGLGVAIKDLIFVR